MLCPKSATPGSDYNMMNVLACEVICKIHANIIYRDPCHPQNIYREWSLTSTEPIKKSYETEKVETARLDLWLWHGPANLQGSIKEKMGER